MFPHRSDEYDAVVTSWLIHFSFELVHIRHIGWHGLGIIESAKTIGIPVIFSFHDFYTVCPTVKLVDNQGASTVEEFCTQGEEIVDTICGDKPIFRR